VQRELGDEERDWKAFSSLQLFDEEGMAEYSSEDIKECYS
jgi:hypothetical protein